jgi:hypothetical protein
MYDYLEGNAKKISKCGTVKIKLSIPQKLTVQGFDLLSAGPKRKKG